MKLWKVFRSAITGRFVKKTEAQAQPATTVGEVMQRKNKKKDA